MIAIAEELDQKMTTWQPAKAAEVERIVTDIIHWADADALELMRSREVEQEVLDLIDEI